MSKTVLDSSAISLFARRNRSEHVAPILETTDGIISSVNYAEIVSKLIDYQMPTEEIQATLNDLKLEVIAFDTQQAFQAGKLRKIGKPLGISLGDRACLALALTLQLPLLTADKNWKKLDIDINIQLLR